MKQKNPLYLVKGKTVHPTGGVWEYLVLKFNLTPVLNILKNLLNYILEQVKDYPSFILAKNFINQIVDQLKFIKERFAL